MKSAFRLRFDPSEIARWAGLYEYVEDAEVVAKGEAARRRGWYTRDEFLAIAEWKTIRTRGLCKRNEESLIREATKFAFCTDVERLRIGVLTLLQGVSMPTASVLLHLAHPDPYPILDYRALWSLTSNARPPYSFQLWQSYTSKCREIAERAAVTMRVLDRALWQFSKENQSSATR